MKNIVYLCLCIILLNACHKDEALLTDDAPNLNSSILFGETKGMIVTSYEQPLLGKTEFDLNADGWDDLKLLNTSWHSPGLGVHFPKAIIPMHSKVLIMGDYLNDTIFSHRTQTITQSLDVIEIRNRQTLTCKRTIPTDSVYYIAQNNFRVRNCNALAKLDLTHSFSNDSLPMEADSYFSSQTTYSPNQDTVYTWENMRYTDCRAMPQNTPFYVGFVWEDNLRKRLGWLKLKYTAPNKFELIESAIQR